LENKDEKETIKKNFLARLERVLADLEDPRVGLADRIALLNEARARLSARSPQQVEPVDCVRWVPAAKVVGNEYNPNKVAPPEMRLLHLSIKEDGYTQPIVAYYDKQEDQYVVVDGFHRYRVGQEYADIRARVHEYLPVVVIDKDINARMASTVRHNRARGTHQVQGMAEIVAELHLKGVSDKRIAEQLGMEKDEILRLKQFVGLGDLFRHRDFSRSWV